jgi:regulator of protease activity HflC (stomatin/prohibitin superfamily)
MKTTTTTIVVIVVVIIITGNDFHPARWAEVMVFGKADRNQSHVTMNIYHSYWYPSCHGLIPQKGSSLKTEEGTLAL